MNATTTFKFRARHRPSPNSSLRIFAEKELELFFFFSGMKLHQESDGVDLDGDGVHPGDDHTHAWPAALGRDGPDFLARRDCNWQDSQNMYCCGVEWAYFTLSAQRGLHFRFGTRRPERRQLPMAFASAGTTYRRTSKQMGLATAAYGMQVDASRQIAAGGTTQEHGNGQVREEKQATIPGDA